MLAEEAEVAADRALRQRADRLLTWRYPRDGARYLLTEDLVRELEGAELVELRIRPAADCTTLYGGHYRDQVWIAEGRDWVMTTSYNGMDGDDWSRSNWGNTIALLCPMTEDLRRLVADLAARYGIGQAA